MKTPLLAYGFLVCGVLAASAVEPAPTPPPMEKIPLPPGPWVTKMPPFAMWRIQFSYTTDKPPAKPGAPEKPEASEKASDDAMLPPRTVQITRTLPYYHVNMQDTAGRSSELWCDGKLSYIQTPGHPTPYLPGLNPNGSSSVPSYLDYSRTDFPDMEWISPKTYIGTLKGETITYLVFRQGDNGATVYIDAEKHRPVRWQNSSETRKFEYLDSPTEPLALPAVISQASRMVRRIDEVTSHRPPRGS